MLWNFSILIINEEQLLWADADGLTNQIAFLFCRRIVFRPFLSWLNDQYGNRSIAENKRGKQTKNYVILFNYHISENVRDPIHSLTLENSCSFRK